MSREMSVSTRAVARAVLGLVLLTGLLVAPAARAAAAPAALRLTATADVDQLPATAGVLNGIAAAAPDANLMVGDLAYDADEQRWCSFVTSHLGALPSLLVAGNHELKPDGSDGQLADFLKCLPQSAYRVSGTYGKEYYVDLPAERPLVRLVMISPGLTFGATPTSRGTKWSYAKGDSHYTWTAAAIDGGRAAGIPWTIVGMHKPCLTMGHYQCDPGADVMNLLVSKRVDLVLSGHEHVYQRTHQLRNGVSGCTALPVGRYNPDCVADRDGSFRRGKGTVFAVVGTGGTPLRTSDLNPSDAEAGYFPSKSQTDYGFLQLDVTTSELAARFVTTSGGSFSDRFRVSAARYVADGFERPAGPGWGTPDRGPAWAASAAASVTGGRGLLRTPAGRHAAASSAIGATSVDVRLDQALSAAPTGSGHYLRVDARVRGRAYYFARVKVTPGGSVYVRLARTSTAGTEATLKGYTRIAGLTVRAGQRLHLRVRVAGTAPTRLSAMAWLGGTPQPKRWAVSASSTYSALQAPGGFRIDSYLSGSVAGSTITAAIDDVSVEAP